MFIFICLARNPRYVCDIKQELFDKPLLHHFHDHILDHLLDLHDQSPSATNSPEYFVACTYLETGEYKNAAAAVKPLIMLSICHYSCSLVKTLCSLQPFYFQNLCTCIIIFVIKDFTQFDWFIFLAKKIRKEKVETLSTILANFFHLKISSENRLESYAHAQ